MSEHREQAETLLAAGLRDQLALRLLRQSGEAPHESMGFHAQQASEKFIKAVLVMHGIVFERTHDLAALAELCIAHHNRDAFARRCVAPTQYLCRDIPL